MQLFKGLVTLGILITGCATSRYTDLGWAEIAARAGDQDEFFPTNRAFPQIKPRQRRALLAPVAIGCCSPRYASNSDSTKDSDAGQRISERPSRSLSTKFLSC